jgi:hypothetical protein
MDKKEIEPIRSDDIKKLCLLLKKHAVNYIIIGGVALGFHGIIRATIDIDMIVQNTEENIKRLYSALSELKENVISEMSIDDFMKNNYGVTRVIDEIVVDVIFNLGEFDYERLASNIEFFRAGDMEIPVLNIDGLILLKDTVRLQDRADRELLLRLKGEGFEKD